LPQAQADLFSQTHQALARPVEQLALVGNSPPCLRLHGRIDHNTAELGGLHHVRPGRDRQALLQQRLELLLPPLRAPTRQRRTVEHQRMLEKLLAAEVPHGRLSILGHQSAGCAVPQCRGISHADATFREALWDRFLHGSAKTAHAVRSAVQ